MNSPDNESVANHSDEQDSSNEQDNTTGSHDDASTDQPLKRWGRLGRSILNGVIGDYLAQENNPLAIQMGFYYQSRRLTLDSSLPGQLDFPLSNKVIVFVHGLTNLETIWDFDPADPLYSNDSIPTNYGTLLRDELGFSPFYLRYNTGLAIEVNGKELAKQLEAMMSAYPIEIDELVLVGFSMGGLLLRHAQNAELSERTEAKKAYSWIDQLSKCIYIGSPHEGSPLEKFGHLTGEVVRNIPLDYVNHWADWIDMRSQGIQDLRHGMKNMNNEPDCEEVCESFAEQAQHYFVSGGIGKSENSMLTHAFGDSLVRRPSAIPSSAPEDITFAHFEGISHVRLAHSSRIYEQIFKWLEVSPTANINKRKSSKNRVEIQPSLFVDPIQDREEEQSNKEMVRGALQLASKAYDEVVDTTKHMHDSISQQTFNILERVPVVNEAAKPVETSIKGISSLVFSSLRAGGDIAKAAVDKLAEQEYVNRTAEEDGENNTSERKD